MAYESNIKMAGLTLAINPEQYVQKFVKLGEFIRTVGGGLIDMNLNGYRLSTELKGLTVTQIEDLKRRFALKKSISFIDYIPIAERTASRTISEDLGSSVVDNETVYLYVPDYNIYIPDFIPQYEGGITTYTMLIEEI